MNDQTHLKTDCWKCDGPIEFPREGAGERVPCPHCGVEVLLTTATPARAPILILPNATPIHVRPPGVALALQAVAALQIIGGFGAVMYGAGIPIAVVSVVSAIVTFALAQLITNAHESATRLARLEIFFQEVVNQRK